MAKRLLLLGIIICSACQAEPQKRPPSGILSDSLYTKILGEFQLIETFESTYTDSITTAQLKQNVLQNYGIDSLSFMQAHNWYALDMQAQRQRLQSIKDSLEHLGERLQIEASKRVKRSKD